MSTVFAANRNTLGFSYSATDVDTNDATIKYSDIPSLLYSNKPLKWTNYAAIDIALFSSKYISNNFDTYYRDY